jgi:hypothetical protein
MRVSLGGMVGASLLAVLLPALAACGAAPAPSAASRARVAPRHVLRSALWRGRPTAVLPGDLLIADSYNNRIIIVNPQKQIIWQFPKPGTRPNVPFNRPDDGFFGPHFDEIITNEEDFDTIAIINFRTERIVWEYGHRTATAGVPGSAPGYLNTPDDAFLLEPKGQSIVTVADIRNQRILFINRKTRAILKQYGETGVQVVNPPTTWGAPNGDFPAPHGGMLVTQINGQDAVLLNRAGHVVYTVHFPFSYPSDANFTPSGDIICAFYDDPGAIVIMSPSGQLLWQYYVTSGPGMLNHPSLAVQLPNGMIAANDDYNDRVIVINPRTKQIVWQYGHTGVPGSAPGYLNIPDGMDYLPPGIVPGNPANHIGGHLWSYPGNGY